MIFNVDIAEHPRTEPTQRQSFDAICRETGHAITGSRDPEHEMAAKLVASGMPDGPMVTWRHMGRPQ
jgi:hypothetical protein